MKNVGWPSRRATAWVPVALPLCGGCIDFALHRSHSTRSREFMKSRDFRNSARLPGHSQVLCHRTKSMNRPHSQSRRVDRPPWTRVSVKRSERPQRGQRFSARSDSSGPSAQSAAASSPSSTADRRSRFDSHSQRSESCSTRMGLLYSRHLASLIGGSQS